VGYVELDSFGIFKAISPGIWAVFGIAVMWALQNGKQLLALVRP
jgi:hypothetical protein